MLEGPKKTQHDGSAGVKRRRHAPALKPKETAKPGAPWGILIAAALGILFVSYLTNAGNVQVGIDGFLASRVEAAHQHDAVVAKVFVTALPFVGMAFVGALLYVMLSAAGIGKSKKKSVKVPREELTLHEFADLALEQGVGARVSREMYRMLLVRHGDRLRTLMGESFAARGVAADAVWGMFEELVSKTGGMIHGAVGVEALPTPVAMMQAAEACVERVALERRALLKKAAETVQETSRTVVVGR